jgi:hypothetical protein
MGEGVICSSRCPADWLLSIYLLEKKNSQDVATFFDLSVTAIIAAVEKQLDQTSVEVCYFTSL